MEKSEFTSLGDSTSVQTIDGDAMIKKLKHELRIKTKAEQLAKEKFGKLNKTFDRTTQEFAKYKEEAEATQQNLKHEIQILQTSLSKSLQESAEMIERTSAGSGCGQTNTSNNDQVFKIVDEYSKQLELKGKEIDGLNEKFGDKKQKYDSIKKRNGDLEQKLQRMEHKLAHMSRFSQIFIRSVKQHNIGLKEQCLSSQREFLALFDQTKKTLETQITQQISFKDRQNAVVLEKERATIVELREKLQEKEASGDQNSEVTVTRMQAEIDKIHSKNDRLKQKLAAVEVEDTERQLQILKVQHEAEKEKFEITLEERQKEIANLKQTITETIAKESHLSTKLETITTEHREEIQRLLERHENSERYKDMREMYENKIETRDAELLTLKQEVIRMQLEGESKEQRHKMFIEEEDVKKKQHQDEEAKKIASMQELTEEQHSKMLGEHKQELCRSEEQLTTQHSQNMEELKVRHAKLLSEREVELYEVFSKSKSELTKEMESVRREGIENEEKGSKEMESVRREGIEKEEKHGKEVEQFEKQIEAKQREKEEEISQLEAKQAQKEEEIRLTVENEKTEASTELTSIVEKWEEEIKQKEKLMEGEKKALLDQIEAVKLSEQEAKEKHNDLLGQLEAVKLSEVEAKEKNKDLVDQIEVVKGQVVNQKPESPEFHHMVQPGVTSMEIEPVPCEELQVLRSQLSEFKISLQEAQENFEKAEEISANQLQSCDAQFTIESAARQSTEQELWRVQQELVTKASEAQELKAKIVELEQEQVSRSQDQKGEQDQEADKGSQSDNQSHDTDSNMQRKVPPRPVSLAARGRPPLKMNPRPMRPAAHSNAQTRQPEQAVNDQSNQQPRTSSPSAPTNPFGATNEQQQKTDTCQDNQSQQENHRQKPEAEHKEAAPQFQAVVQKPEAKEAPLIKTDQQEVKKVDSPAPKVKREKKEEEQKKEDTVPQSRFSALLSSLVSTIIPWQRKEAPKQAHMGVPGAPKYNKETGRYEFEDDSDESDHAPLAPPPSMTIKPAEVVEEAAPSQSEQTTAADLTKPVLNAVMRKRQAQKEKEKKEKAASSQKPKQEKSVDVSQNETLYRTAIADTSEIDSRQIQDLQLQLDQANDALIEQERKQNSDKIENQINVERIYKELTEEDAKRNKEIVQLRKVLGKRGSEQAGNRQLQREYNELQVDYEEKRMESVELRKELIKCEGRVEITTLQLDAQQEIIDQSQGERVLRERELIKRQLQDHQRQNETLQWEKSLLQAQQMAAQFTESATVHTLQGKLSASQVRISQLESEMTRVSAAELHKVQEALRMASRDTESYRESTSRLQAERERMATQLREKAQEHNQQLRRVEQERARGEGEYRKAINDKEQAWQRRINEIQQSKDKEVQQLQALAREKDSQISKASHDKQRERNQAERQLSQLAQMMNKSEEQSQEIQSMDSIRNKLNEHIIYLQNEVRKRDDMLDGNSDSEIDLDNEDDSGDLDILRQSTPSHRRSEQSQSIHSKRTDVDQAGLDRPKRTTMTKLLAGQLEETRANLKEEIESRLTLEKQLETEQAKLAKLTEGLYDIKNLLPQESGDEEDDDLLADIMKQFFSMQGKFDSQLMDYQHKLEMLEFEVNDVETLRFDLDIAASEKSLLENHIHKLKQQVEKNEEQNQQVKLELLQERSSQLEREFSERLEQMETEKSKMEQAFGEKSKSWIAQISRLTETNASKVQDLQSELQSMTGLNDNLQLQVKTQMEAKDRSVSEKDRQISELHQSLIGAEKSITECKSKLAASQGEVTEKDEQVSFIEQKMEQMQEAILLKKQEMKTKIDNLKTAGRMHISQSKVQIEQLEAELMQAKEEVANLQSTVETKEMELTAEVAAKESELDFANAANTSVLAENESILEGLRAKVSQLEEELTSSTTKELESAEASAAKESELAAVKARESDLRKFATDKADELESAIATQEETQTAIAAKEEELRALRVELSNGDDVTAKLNLSLRSQIETLQTEKESNEAKLGEEREKLVVARSELLANITMMAEASNQIDEKEQQIMHLQSNVHANNEGENESLKEERDGLKEERESLKSEKDSLMKEKDSLQEEKDSLKEEKDSLKEERDTLKEEIDSQQTQFQQAVKQNQEKQKQKREKLEGKLQKAGEVLEEKEAQLTENESMIEALRSEMRMMSGDVTDKVEAMDAAQNAEAKIALKQQELDEQKEQYQMKEQEVFEKQQELNQKEAEYQSQTIDLVTKLKEKHKEKAAKVKSELKQLQGEYCDIQSDNEKLTQQHMLLQKANDGLLDEKMQFSESVDFTKIELEREKSNFEVELKLLNETKDDHKNQVEMAFRAMLQKHNMNPNETHDFEELLSRCSEVLGNYVEEKRQIQKIVEEKEEAVRGKESLSFQLENITAQRDLLQNKMERMGQNDYDQQLTKTLEEKAEMKHQFMIQFTSFSDEISILSNKLSKYEPNKPQTKVSKEKPQQKENSSEPSPQQTEDQDGSEYEYESEEDEGDQKPAQAGMGSYFASFFLTESELKK